MAELTAQQIDALMRNQMSIERNRSEMEDFRQQDIPPIINELRGVNSKLNSLMDSVSRVVKQVNKPPVIENDTVQSDVEEKQTEKSIKPLETISKHLLDIKEFLVKTFSPDPSKPPTGLSQSTKDDSSPTKDLKETSEKIQKQNKDVVSASQSALGWLGALFTIGAIPVIANTLGIGAAGGVSGGILSKVLPKIIPVGKAVMRRIPIIGTLLSWYEGYKKIKAGGFDNIVFGLMDVAAGFAYAFPGVGTAIGLGIDVLQYFLTNKANEWKKETGNTSFFGSMYNQIIEYLSETAPIKWLSELGSRFKAIWDDPSYDNLMSLFDHLGAGFQGIKNMFLTLNKDAGAALGLTDEEGNTTGLFEWLHSKVKEYIIEPVKDLFTAVFGFVGRLLSNIQDGIADMILTAVDKIPMPSMIRNQIKNFLELPSAEDKAAMDDMNKKAAAKNIDVNKPTNVSGVIERRASRAGLDVGDFQFLDDEIRSLGPDSPLYKLWNQGKYKEAMDLRHEMQMKKVNESPEIPKLDVDVELDSPPMSSNVQNNVSNITSTTYVLPESPSMRVGAIA